MKLRKLAVALALVGGLGSNLAHALGLGGAELRSNLNEPLRAEIALVGLGSVSPADITARLASSTDFQRAGVERAAWLADLQFRVIRDGQNRPVVEVSSRRPIREPFVNFLVELNWPSGRLLREYALLVDPPLYRPAPLAAPSVPSSSVRAPTSAPQVREPARAPAPSAPGESRYTGQPGSYGPVRADDTLWSIALRTRPDSSITPQQMMLAIQDQNPDAFQNGNINRLKRGAVLRIPDRQQAMQRTPREAFAQVTAQNEQLRRPSTERAPVDATARAPRPAAPAAPTPGDDELRLIVADTDKPQEQASHGGAVAVEGGTGGDTRLALTMEQLDKAQRDNAELSTRVKALEEQLQTMQRLVEVKDDRLSQLQAQMGGVAEAGSDAVVPGVDALPTAGDAGQTVATESTSSDTPAAVTSTDTAAASAEPVPTGEAATSTDMTVAPEAEATADVAPEPAVVAATETPVQPTVPAPVPAPAREPDLFEQIMTNPLYMIAAGGSAVLLLIILGLIARRNANQEKHFYDALKQTEAESGDERPIDLGAGLAGASSGASRATTVDGEDPLAEADIYLAYGRLDQAASVLEGAISKEPTRADLRLKLLEVYKGIGDNAAFEKQYQEIASMDDAAALRQADALRDRGGDEEGPSLSELQSALKSTGAGGAASVAAKTAAVAGGAYMVAREDVPAEPEGAEKSESIDFDLTGIDLKGIKGEAVETETTPLTQEAEGSDWISDFDLEIEESPAAVVEAVESAADELGMLEADFELDEAALDEHDGVEGAASLEEDDDTLLADLDLSDFGDVAEPVAEVSEETSLDADFDLADLGEDLSGEAPVTAEVAAVPEAVVEEPLVDEEPLGDLEAVSEEDFDDSFLADLDAELERVGVDEELPDVAESASGELESLVAEPGETSADEFSLDAELDDLGSLELDVSADDLALIGEVASPTEEEASLGAEMIEAPVEEAVALADEEPLLDLETPSEDALSLEADLDLDSAFEDAADLVAEEPVADVAGGDVSESEAASARIVEDEFDDALLDVPVEAVLGEEDVPALSPASAEDEFDFLADTDEAATKLDLARAYMEMGDYEGARDILEEVALEGSDAQKSEANDLIKKLV